MSRNYNSNLKILVVEDDGQARRLIVELLETIGKYQVFEAKNGIEAIEFAEKFVPNLILLDLKMPGLDGLKICKILNSSPHSNNIPIIILSASVDLDEKVECFRAGGVDFISKPYESNDLLARIRRHLEISNLQLLLEDIMNSTSAELINAKLNLKKTNSLLSQHNFAQANNPNGYDIGILKIDKQGVCIYANEFATLLLGFSALDKIVGSNIHMIAICGADHSNSSNFFNSKIYRMPTHVDSDTWLKANGEKIKVEFHTEPVTEHDDSVNAIVYFNQITEIDADDSNFFNLAYKDSLTGLYNRTVFFDSLLSHITQYRRFQLPFALFLFDLDSFKSINDSLGHMMGDDLLCVVAKRLLKSVRSPDSISRLAGDEFCLILSDFVDDTEVVNVSKRICDELGKPYEIRSTRISLKVSVGIVIFDNFDDNADDIMTYADLALYRAKQTNPGGFCLFDNEMKIQMKNEMRISHQLEDVISKNQLQIEYQPQFYAETGCLFGAEALVRWNHPTRGLLMPAQFISMAEKKGIIDQISYWVFEQAISDSSKWRRSGYNLEYISINICAQQLADNYFREKILKVVEKNQTPLTGIILELTETTLIDTKMSKNTLEELSSLGIKIAIDDFGTGYSSMSVLKDLHVDILKIDIEFITNLLENDKNSKIVQALIDFGKALDLKVVAEGVENKQQFDFLSNSGCDIVQGFYFGRSYSAGSFEKLFLNKN